MASKALYWRIFVSPVQAFGRHLPVALLCRSARDFRRLAVLLQEDRRGSCSQGEESSAVQAFGRHLPVALLCRSARDFRRLAVLLQEDRRGSCSQGEESSAVQVPQSVCSKSCPPGFRKVALEGQPVCCFGCVQCLQGEISNQTDSIECMKCSWDQWPDSQKSNCLPKLIEFFSLEEPLGVTLAAISILSSFAPVLILSIFIQHKHTPIIKANNYVLSCLLLALLCLCFLCSLVFIGYPQNEKCLLRQVSFGLVFALCVSCILAKTIMVVLAFMATRPGSSLRKWTRPQVPFVIIFLCFLIQFTVCIIWLSFSPPFAQSNIQTKPGVIILDCNEGSLIAFWTMLGYLFLLATISFIVAFLARRLPDSFNEAQYITFSMLAFLSVWISFIPAYLSAQGKYTVAMEIFAILASSWALVISMFLPKCFIILFRPIMNSREYLMGRNKAHGITE
ncbi:vomeronasal type-2 receptor 26-like [Hyperolius riggenbachi]|uniref:vomeronasal type-2 receptor 26-like n=1 Tax=Hyperolius riggenbachi TaxID=752182 RepID=UPI0035A2A8DB